MKKIILSMCLMLLTFATFSQSASKYVAMTNNGAALTNAGTTYVSIVPTIFYEAVSFQAVVTKGTGTPDGIATLQYSNDGVNYIEMDITDSLSIADQTTNTKVFVKTFNPAMYYRIAFVGRGTQASTVSGFFWGAGVNNNKIGKQMLSNYSLTSDTITNSGTGYVEFTLNSFYERVSFQPVVTKLSGTAAGTVTLQGSIDGTNFVTVASSYVTAATMSVTNVTTSTSMLIVTDSPYRYYRLSYTGSGTMSCTLKGYLVANN
jgi:hypothetical protein